MASNTTTTNTDHNPSVDQPPTVDPNDYTHILEANRKFFDNFAPTYSRPSHRRVSERIAAAILGNPQFIPLDEGRTRLLDYACGTGLLSQALLPHVASVVGIDISPGMVAAYNEAAKNQGLEKEEMAAYCVGDERGVGGGAFDVALCVLAFHHMPEPATTTREIAGMLREGGVFVVVDFCEHQGEGEHGHGHGHGDGHGHGNGHHHDHHGHDEAKDGGHGHVHPHPPHGEHNQGHDEEKHTDEVPEIPRKHVVVHHGFSEAEVGEWFLAAGLGEPKFLEVGGNGHGTSVVEIGTVKRRVFMAVGRKV